jgi:hypothetical protein
MKYRICEIYGRVRNDVYTPYYTLEYRPDWWPFWFTDYVDTDIDSLKQRALNHFRELSFKKKTVVSGTIDDIMAFGG